MLKVHIEQREYWDDAHQQFVYVGPQIPVDLKLEHSLVSVSKWESKYHKSYTNTDNKTIDETLDYIAMMVVGDMEDEVDPNWFRALSKEQIQGIHDYINDPMTATTISEDTTKNNGNKKINNRIVTAELLYCWMVQLSIPFECQHWHFNKLVTLIKVCSIESDPDKNKKKKMTSADKAARKARMDAARAKYKH